MTLFYAPDIQPPRYTLNEEESRHCVRVLRLGAGDALWLTDGRGTLYTAQIIEADPKACEVEVVETVEEYGRRSYSLTMAVAPTKNIERFEWFLEKATEVGCDCFIPLDCRHSERRVIKAERELKVITSAVKQSLKAYHPDLTPMTSVAEVIRRPFEGVKLIAHCRAALVERSLLKDCVHPGEDVLILIGPEGDFSEEEIRAAVEHGFREVSLGDSRLRTETAALAAVMAVSFINQ